MVVTVMATMMVVVMVTTVAIGGIHGNTAVLNIAGVVTRVPVEVGCFPTCGSSGSSGEMEEEEVIRVAIGR